jgi:hypothetical protein
VSTVAGLVARCHPALAPFLPEPVPAADALPGWLRDMPSEAPAQSLGGAGVRTLKHCPPLIDAMSLGLLMPLACDLRVVNGVISWDWDLPAVPDQLFGRSPIGLHAPEQATGAPLRLDGRFALKFMNFWTLEAPEGWSVLFTHPLNREDLPFRTLSGVVDCDRFGDGFVHFPALWTDPGFDGVLKAGVPVAQAIAFPRGPLSLTVATMDAGRAKATRDAQAALRADRGVYRRKFRARAR